MEKPIHDSVPPFAKILIADKIIYVYMFVVKSQFA